MEVGGEGDYVPIATLSPPNDFCVKVDSDESHNCEGQSHKTVSTDHNLNSWVSRKLGILECIQAFVRQKNDKAKC